MTNMYTDVMLDIETLDTLPSAAIVQIGAVAFNFHDASIRVSDPLTIAVKPDLSRRTTSYETLQFWMKQSDEARLAVFEGEGKHLDIALADLSMWYRSKGSIDRVWAMPPTFDIVILENAMRFYGLDAPWKYNEPRCVRTLADIAGATKDDRVKPLIAHDAGHDAFAQAQFVLKCRSMIWQRGI